MQDGLFFRIVRRINMLLVLVIALGLLAGGAFIGWQKYKEGDFSFTPYDGIYKPPHLTADKMKPHYNVALAPYEAPIDPAHPAINGIFVLNRTMFGPYSYAETGEVANIMEIDDKTGEGHWLFKGADRNITFRGGVRKGDLPDGAATDDRPLIGLVLWVVEKDANKDGSYGFEDPISAYVWRFGETKPTKLFEADDGLSTGQMNGKLYAVVYVKGGKHISATYSIPDFKLVSEKVLPDPLK